MESSLQTWALPRIKRLLPLDDQSLVQVLTYSTSLSRTEGAEHLKNLLGDSAAALEFISTFSSRRRDPSPAPAAVSTQVNVQDSDSVSGSRKKAPKKSKPPLHAAGPVRQPDGYGNVSGGYQKTSSPDALQLPKVTQGGRSSPVSELSRDNSPMGGNPARLPPSASGSLISDFMPNVRSKQSKSKHHSPHQSLSQPASGTSTPHLRPSNTNKNNQTTTSSISDLTSAIAALELSTNPSLSTSSRNCSCATTLHPLFTPAPNCLSCGKIICALEGLQPCSSCNSPLLSSSEIQSMITSLRQERGVQRTSIHNAGIASNRSGTSTGTHTPNPSFPFATSSHSVSGIATPDSPASDNESTSAAVRARLHRDKLLTYQSQNTQRTRIHDEAADFDFGTANTKGMQWMTPVQRAAALKKQQKYMKDLEEANKPEWEREKRVLSLSVRDGKLVKSYKKEKNTAAVTSNSVGDGRRTDSDMDTDIDIDAETDGVGVNGTSPAPSRKTAFSNNPLLASGGLIRPIWKPRDSMGVDGDGAGGSADVGTPASSADVGTHGSSASRAITSTTQPNESTSTLKPTSTPQSTSTSTSTRSRQNIWRRVQDDNDDNEAWILDGGVHGYGSGTGTGVRNREMEMKDE